MNKRKWILTGCVLLLLSSAGVGVSGLFSGTDPAVAKLQEIGGQMWDKNLPDAQRDLLRGQFRQQMESMTDAQRRAFFDANREEWQQRSALRMNEFFAMSKADQTKRLDEIINRAAQRQRNAQPNPQQNTNRGGGGGRNRNMSEAQREERSKRRLDSSSPKLRAQYSEFRKMLDKRSLERGVRIEGDFGRGFGGGRG